MSERHSTEVTADALETGDRISTKLVAPDATLFGRPLQNPPEANDGDEPDTQLVRVTQTDRMDDVHSAILLDPETQTFIRAGRHDSQSAWSQAEADWSVKEIGEDIIVEEVHELSRPDDEQDEGREEYVQTWANILFDEIRYFSGDQDLQDELETQGTTLTMSDFDGRKAVASVTLE